MLLHCTITWLGCILIFKFRKCTIVKTNMANYFGNSDILHNMQIFLWSTRLWYFWNKWKDAILVISVLNRTRGIWSHHRAGRSRRGGGYLSTWHRKKLTIEELEAIVEGKPLITVKNIICLFLLFKWNISYQPNSFPESSQDSTIAESLISREAQPTTPSSYEGE